MVQAELDDVTHTNVGRVDKNKIAFKTQLGKPPRSTKKDTFVDIVR